MIIHPCYIGENVVIKDSVIGPHVSLGAIECRRVCHF